MLINAAPLAESVIFKFPVKGTKHNSINREIFSSELLRVCRMKKILDILLLIMYFSAITNGALTPSRILTLQEVHLVRCLIYINNRYLAPGRSLVISSPSNYRDVQQELIAEIHRTSIWSVVVTIDRKISIPEKSNFIARDGSYINTRWEIQEF